MKVLLVRPCDHFFQSRAHILAPAGAQGRGLSANRLLSLKQDGVFSASRFEKIHIYNAMNNAIEVQGPAPCDCMYKLR